jgi:hypothetical protein
MSHFLVPLLAMLGWTLQPVGLLLFGLPYARRGLSWRAAFTPLEFDTTQKGERDKRTARAMQRAGMAAFCSGLALAVLCEVARRVWVR